MRGIDDKLFVRDRTSLNVLQLGHIRPSRKKSRAPADERLQSGVSGPVEDSRDPSGTVLARTLSTIVEHARWNTAIRRNELTEGDQIVVTTRNSTYMMWFLGGNEFAVRGGWFDQQGLSPMVIRINGCTYGRSAIRHDVVAAIGLFLEFGNNVRTTRIQELKVLKSHEPTVVH